jgi:alanine racemase
MTATVTTGITETPAAMPASDPICGSARLHIDLAAIVANWRRLGALHPGGAVAGVVKADAYGLGAERVAPALHAAGCRFFFTAHLAEALALRRLVPGAVLSVLNGLLPGCEDAYLAHDIQPVLGSLDEIARWAALARRHGRPLPAMLHVDTGMNRLGLDARELALLQADHALLDGIALSHVMTHLVSAERPNDPINEAQRRRFDTACRGLPPLPRSLANSSGIFLGPAFGSDLARPGAALYGINPTPGRANPQDDVVRLEARVLQLRDVPVGEGVGYNGCWRAARPSRIATVAVGYADGWLRSLSNRGQGFFDGMGVPLVGRVSMDLTTFDVTDHPAIGPGSWLELIGPHCPPDLVAEAAGTNGYEILTLLGRRYARTYSE